MSKNKRYPLTQWQIFAIAVVIALIAGQFFLPNGFNFVNSETPSLTSTFFTPSTTITSTTSSTPTLHITTDATPSERLSDTPTSSATSTYTPTPSLTASATPDIEPSPTPMKGEVETNIPPGYRIGPWHDDHMECDMNRRHYLVRLYSVEVAGDTHSYEITFWEPDGKKTFQIAPFKDKLVLYDLDVEVRKGEHIYVEITFSLANGETAYWSDHLYYHYLNDPACPEH